MRRGAEGEGPPGEPRRKRAGMPYASRALERARAIPRSAAAAGFDRARRGRRPVRAWRHGVRGRTSNLSTVGVTISTTRAAGRAEVNRDEVCSGERRRRQSFKCSVLRFPLTSGALGHHAAEEQRHWGAPPSGRITEGRRRRRDPEDAARYLSPFPRRRHRDAARWRWVQSHGGREGPRHVRHAPRGGFRDDPRGYDPPRLAHDPSVAREAFRTLARGHDSRARRPHALARQSGEVRRCETRSREDLVRAPPRPDALLHEGVRDVRRAGGFGGAPRPEHRLHRLHAARGARVGVARRHSDGAAVAAKPESCASEVARFDAVAALAAEGWRETAWLFLEAAREANARHSEETDSIASRGFGGLLFSNPPTRRPRASARPRAGREEGRRAGARRADAPLDSGPDDRVAFAARAAFACDCVETFDVKKYVALAISDVVNARGALQRAMSAFLEKCPRGVAVIA